MDELDNITQEFLVETTENLDQLDKDLLVLEKDPANRDTLASIFRTIHTIKGTCGFLGFAKLEALAHVGEHLLGLLRDGDIELESKRITTLFVMVDAIREILAAIDQTGKEGEKEYSDLIKTLIALQSDPGKPEAAGAAEGNAPPAEEPAPKAKQTAVPGQKFLQSVLPPAASPPRPPAKVNPSRDPAGTLLDRVGGMAVIRSVNRVFCQRLRRDGQLKRFYGKVKADSLRKTQVTVLTLAISGPATAGPQSFWKEQERFGAPAEVFPQVQKHLEEALATQKVEASVQEEIVNRLDPPAFEHEAPAPASTASSVPPSEASAVPTRNEGEVAPSMDGGLAGPSLAEASIRVDVTLLDKLMNLVGELVLARNQVLQYTSSQMSSDAALTAATARLNLVTSELQEGVMQTRMQPIGNVWDKLPRVVRDMAHACKKQIRVEMEGKDTELDKTLIEAIKDPLTHLVRNAVDHGFELPDARVAAGKKAEGRLLLRSFHEGGHVNIEVIDDGAGIDLEKVKEKALSRGLITPENAHRMSERELSHLVFRPGFSTAEKVSNLSGRGVGMDVVKTNIEKISGSVELQTSPGKGTTVKIKIPLTLAIIPALVVTCGSDRYAIPQVSLLELVRVEGDRMKEQIEMIQDAPVYRLRGSLLPLVYLRETLRLEDQTQESEENDGVNIVVLQADERQFGLVVDRVQDTEEIVVKPLGTQMKSLGVFSGATIMGDGNVALILDVVGLRQRASVITQQASEQAETLAEEEVFDEASGIRQTLLIFEVGDDRRMAMPLSLVARLEEIPRSSVEFTGKQAVVQYRGEIMPIISLAEIFGAQLTGETAQEDTLQMVVYTEQGRSAGLVVSRIVDIVDELIEIQSEHKLEGLVGSAVVQGRVTDMIDVNLVIGRIDPSFFEQLAVAGVEE